MKKILIASYYFPPCNIVAAQRAESLADNFKQHGLHPIVVTRHWNGDENSTPGYESENLTPPIVTEKENYTLIQLPYAATLDKFYHRLWLKSRARKLLLYTALYSAGNINPKCDAFEFYDYMVNYLSENPVDYIFATGFPMNTIKLGHRLAVKMDIPYIADFRDLWDNNLLAENYTPDLPARIQNNFYKFYLQKWLQSAQLVTSVTQPLIEEIKRLAPHAKSLVVTNGFEADLFAKAQQQFAAPTDKFVFSVIGTLKPEQQLSVMLDGLKLFLADKNSSEIELNFVGTAEFPAVKRLIEENLPPLSTKVTDRVPRCQAIEQMLSSNVLFYAGWRGFRGIASGKIYEYLGARRNILIAPGDRDFLEEIINETRAGKIADTPEEFAAALNSWFEEWRRTGEIKYYGEPEKISFYTRENQARILAQEILKINS
ncbi:MAG: hypothetical protein ABI954_07170 [Pyrinomonadaceae bacterium]